MRLYELKASHVKTKFLVNCRWNLSWRPKLTIANGIHSSIEEFTLQPSGFENHFWKSFHLEILCITLIWIVTPGNPTVRFFLSTRVVAKIRRFGRLRSETLSNCSSNSSVENHSSDCIKDREDCAHFPECSEDRETISRICILIPYSTSSTLMKKCLAEKASLRVLTTQINQLGVIGLQPFDVVQTLCMHLWTQIFIRGQHPSINHEDVTSLRVKLPVNDRYRNRKE